MLPNSPYNDPSLAVSTGTAQQSPFVIAFQRSGVKVVPSIINAVVCTSAISSGSACIFIASRTLYGLSCDGHAPRFFQRCNRFGSPHYAIGLTCLLLPLVYLNVANNTSVVFGWFVNITTVSGLIGWVVIEATYLRFYAGLKSQGYSRDGKTGYPTNAEYYSANETCSASLQKSTAAIYFMGDHVCGEPRHSFLRYVAWLVEYMLVIFFSQVNRVRRIRQRSFYCRGVFDLLPEHCHIYRCVPALSI